jgi:hypothetical protein
MAETKMPLPFEASTEDIMRDAEPFVDSVFACLESEFMVMPRGRGFIDYPTFEAGYQAVKRATEGFASLSPDRVCQVTAEVPVSLIVLRAMLGFTPPEWAYVTTKRTGTAIPQGAARTIDRRVRLSPVQPLHLRGVTAQRVRCLVETACAMLEEGAPELSPAVIHRLDKADTRHGRTSLCNLDAIGVPYAMMLYERFLGRPFAGHRDSVSDLIGSGLEAAIEDVLNRAGISFRKTGRAERIPGFPQNPDFIVPDEFNPRVIIEAKIAEDDGTARDKVARIQQLRTLSVEGRGEDNPRYEVVACIAGRGFRQRREDMKRMLSATRGKVFTLKTLDRLVECTALRSFRTKTE